MSEEEIQVGDLVWLKSGGPRMTVSAVSGEIVMCVWFPNSSELKVQELTTRIVTKKLPATPG